MTRHPWMKFYPADWRADPALRMCEPLSRYVWLEMLGIMHEADPYGHLLVNGIAVTDEALSRLIDVPLKAVRSSLKELAKNGVYSITDDGVILSRRMVRDDFKARSNRDNGKKGGNPSLKNQEVSTVSVNPSDKGEVKAHIPEARSQIEKREANASPKKGTRLPDDWSPDIEFAVSVGLSQAKALVEAEKFREWWPAQPGQKGVKLDWDLTWKTWCRKSAERFSSNQSQGPPRKTAFQQHQDDCAAELDKVINRNRGHDEPTDNVIDLAAADYRYR